MGKQDFFDFLTGRLGVFIYSLVCAFLLLLVVGYAFIPAVHLYYGGKIYFPGRDELLKYVKLSAMVGTVATLGGILEMVLEAVRRFMKRNEEKE